MQAGKIGDRQVLIIFGIGLVIAQLIFSYLGLGGRSLFKSFCWFLKNRYKLSSYLCFISVLVCSGLYGQITEKKWYVQSGNFLLLFLLHGFPCWQKTGIAGSYSNITRKFMPGTFTAINLLQQKPAANTYPVC